MTGLLFVTALLGAGTAHAGAPPDVADNLVQTAINGSYDSALHNLTLRGVQSSRTASGAPAALVRTAAWVDSFAEVYATAEAAPLATLVVHDGAADGQRSHHLVRVLTPRFLPASDTITYSIELLDPASPPPATIDRAFLVFGPGDLAAAIDPEPLLPPDDFTLEAVSTETIRGGVYDPVAGRLRLRGVQHVLLTKGRRLRSMAFAMADLAERIEVAYRLSGVETAAVFSWTAGTKIQQAVVVLRDFEFDPAADEVTYTIKVIQSSAPMSRTFGMASLTIPPPVSFRPFPPFLPACCDCGFECAAVWTFTGRCETCVSQGGDRCCSMCNLPRNSGGGACNLSDGPGLATGAFNEQLIVGILAARGTRLLVATSQDGLNFGLPRAVPNQSSNRGPGLVAFNDVVVMGYRAADTSNNLWATLSDDGGVNFVGAFAVNGQQSPEPPALAVYAGQVWMAYRANDVSNQIFLTASSDGKTWGRAVPLTGQTSKAKTALAAFKGSLVVAYLANDDTNRLFVTTTNLVKSNTVVIPNQQSNKAPALTVFMDRLVVAYKANDPTNRLFVTSSADGVRFDGPTVVGGQTTAQPPALIAFGGRLYLSYVANDTTSRIFLTSSADGLNFGNVVQLSGN